jgi:HD-like signal output (HDOD) protein/CheY-like chemotaxis protein
VKRILFVDDEPKILEGLERMLHSQRHRWEMAFAPGGPAALAMLETAPFDVIISDMRMPGMDGAALLKIVRTKYPGMLRIILSGYTELSAAFNAVPVAHQFLVKPCDSATLRLAIDRATSLNEVLNSKMLANLVGSVEQLPSMSTTFMEMHAVFNDLNGSISRISEIIERDPAMCAKILQLVNSAFFGVVRSVTDVQTAVSCLGLNVLQSLVLSVEIFRAFHPVRPIPGFSLPDVSVHAQLTSKIAAGIGGANLISGIGLCTGLLHDVGKLVLAEVAPDHLARAIEGAHLDRVPLYVAEENLIGVSHAEVGAYLLAMWGVPHLIVEAVAHHHHPERVAHEKLDLVSSLYFANWIANDYEARTSPNLNTYAELNEDIVTTLGVSSKFEEWQQIAGSVAPQLLRV